MGDGGGQHPILIANCQLLTICLDPTRFMQMQNLLASGRDTQGYNLQAMYSCLCQNSTMTWHKVPFPDLNQVDFVPENQTCA